MGSLKLQRQRGFTIVELLIVIVVIGILAAIVITSFAGVQAKARDTERTTDVKSIATQIEAYYNGDGNSLYPSATTMASLSSVQGALKGIDAGALSAPGRTSFDLATATAFTGPSTTTPGSTKDSYVYVPLASNGTTIVTGGTQPAKFKIVYTLEGDGVKVKDSLN